VAVEDSHHGVEAAARAFMSCIAVPYFPDPPLDPRFAMADLLFERGMAGFDEGRAFAWIEARLHG
jgi:beta-phosphoglucomutase-like phosphatase (HAD superfamily)